jgi:adenylate cyclase class 2
VLDELPFGDFVELEGDETVIRDLARRLELDWGRRVLDSYIALMAMLQEHHQLPFSDLTFANFPNRQPSVADILG